MGKKCVSLLLAAMAVLLAGCSSAEPESTGSPTAQTDQEDPQALLEEARGNFEKETLKSMELSTVTTYDDGIQEEEDTTYIYDTKKQVIESLSQDEDGVETYLHDFHVKDGDAYMVYTVDEYGDGSWVVYEEELEDGEQSEYEYLQEEFSLDIDEEHGFRDITYSNEGEDVINDVDAIKLKVTAEEEYDTGELETEEMTRQSVLEDFGWTEEEVEAVDGFSDVLDNYVTASSQQNGLQEIQTTVTVWIGADNHQLLRVRSEQDVESGQDEGVEEMLETFQNERWKIDFVHSLVSGEGKTLREAKESLEEEIQKMENPQDTEEEPDGADTQETASGDAQDPQEASSEEDSFYASVVKIVTTKRFKTAERCPEMGEIPEDAEKVTQNDYYERTFENYQEYYEELETEEYEGEDQIEEYDDSGDVAE